MMRKVGVTGRDTASLESLAVNVCLYMYVQTNLAKVVVVVFPSRENFDLRNSVSYVLELRAVSYLPLRRRQSGGRCSDAGSVFTKSGGLGNQHQSLMHAHLKSNPRR